jgi:processing peptidase subunit alpha
MGVLQYILLGGTSFSAGGPGKGMYSRLHLNVLNRHHLVERAESFFSCYSDSSLIGIWMTAHPSYAAKIPSIIADQLHCLTGPMSRGITEEELLRAKNQFRSRLVMIGEQRMVAVEGE